MNKKQVIGLIVVLSTGCSSPRPSIPAAGPDVNGGERQSARPVDPVSARRNLEVIKNETN